MDVIKLVVLTWRDYVGLLEWIPSAFTCFLLRQKQREILTLSHKKGNDMTAQSDVGFEDWSDKATSQGMPAAGHQKVGEARRDSPRMKHCHLQQHEWI